MADSILLTLDDIQPSPNTVARITIVDGRVIYRPTENLANLASSINVSGPQTESDQETIEVFRDNRVSNVEVIEREQDFRQFGRVGWFKGCIPLNVCQFFGRHLNLYFKHYGIEVEKDIEDLVSNYDSTCMFSALEKAFSEQNIGIDYAQLVSIWKNSYFGGRVQQRLLSEIAKKLNVIIQLTVIDKKKNIIRYYNDKELVPGSKRKYIKRLLRSDGTEKPIIRLVKCREHLMYNTKFVTDKYFPLGLIGNKCGYDYTKWHLVLQDSNYIKRSRTINSCTFYLSTILRKLEIFNLIKPLPPRIRANQSLSNTKTIDRVFLEEHYIPKVEPTVRDDKGKIVFQGNCEIFPYTQRPTPEFQVWYCDTETTTDLEYLDLYMIAGYSTSLDEKICFDVVKDGEKAVKKFLRKVCDRSPERDILCYFHNLKFDIKFVFNHLYTHIDKNPTKEKGDFSVHKQILMSNNKVYSAVGAFYDSQGEHRRIEFRDTYHHLDCSLSSMPQMFNLKIAKQPDFPYSLYNTDNIRKCDKDGCIRVDEISLGQNFVLGHFIETLIDKPSPLSDEYFTNHRAPQLGFNIEGFAIEHYLKNIPEEYFIDLDEVRFLRLMSYARDYCILDVMVLAQCFEAYRELTREATKIDPIDCLTISSLAGRYLRDNGAYDDVSRVSESLREYISQSAVGGRVQMADNKPQMGDEDLPTFDCVSLYPSAMATIEGYPNGIPKEFSGTPPSDSIFYIATVRLEAIAKSNRFGVLSERKDSKLRWFTDKSCVGKTFILTQKAIEQSEKHMGAVFSYVGGIFWRESFNTTICDINRNLFELRKKFKKEKNPIEKIYKKLLNSLYGKALEKPHFDCLEILHCKRAEAINKFLNKQHPIELVCGSIVEKPDEKQDWHLSYKHAINNHQNYSFCASYVLDRAREIVNEVIIELQDECVYTDTDSMYLTAKGSDILKSRFPNIIGKNLGQLHDDYEHPAYPEVEDWVGVDWVFLNKKLYCIKVLSKSCPNKYFYKIRSKGITTKDLENQCRDWGITPIDLFKRAYAGEEFEFDLSKYGIRFKFNSTSIEVVEEQKRTLKL